MSRVLSAVAWPYANGPRHIGHVAGFGVPSDVFSRYMRMAGHDVLMVSGTDEHGTPILVAADHEGVTPRELADKNNAVIVQDLVDLGLSYDLFTRTTTGNHYRVVQEMFTTVHRNGYMVEQTTLSAISPSTGRTLPDRYIEGTCPICGYAEARGDQCDNCGNQLDPTDLMTRGRRSTARRRTSSRRQHFFLDLPALAEALGEWLDEREASGTWRPNVIKFSQNILEEIRPRAMTPRHRLGDPDPAGRLAGPAHQAALRLVRRRHRLPLRVHRVGSAPPIRARRPGALARLVERDPDGEGPVLLLHGQGQHRLPQPDLARRAAGVRRARRPRRVAGGVRRAQPADRGGVERVPHHGEPAVLHQPRPRDLRRRLAGPLPARRAALLHLRRRPGDLGRGLHLGGVRPPATTPSWSPAGATWSTAPPR